ncbi:mitochondrial import receptor subunit Tom37 like [Lecanosticta acicola]|uniref:Mitochondrial import receptor subunit Tom37 like n=1 Tax=Lecanosticta acicola TaxID=111012 RepID=A0AAI9E659_9PEZI|nr:mitochondrial import receptor subunit Tom37 like [Lecanosticta acicola]
MPMQLFILGPAFGLPSIDAECNATVALLQLRAKDGYQIIPTHQQPHRLPLLIDGRTRVSGFSDIVRHFVNKRIFNKSSLLNAKQQADSFAISSFVECNAQTLLDISLYVGFENYRLATRPAFTKILPWHANYIVPPQRRAAARTRTEHLGISSIDVDNVHEDMSNRPPGFEAVGKDATFEAETQKRASLLLPRKDTLRSLLQRPKHAAVFKLHALAENFFEPLQDLLEDNLYMLGGQEATSVDCLLYGYLSLMLHPKLPQDWLASILRRKYTKLVKYIERLHEVLNLETNSDEVMALSSTGHQSLPWQATASSSILQSLDEIHHGIRDQLPVYGTSDQLCLLHSKPFAFFQRDHRASMLTTCAFLAAMGYMTLRMGWVVWPHGDEVQIFGRKRLADYGHLGAALAGVSLLGSQTGHGT